LTDLLPSQKGDFYGVLKAMHGLPVVIRLIDPPLHEFLPSHDELLEEVTELRVRGNDPERLATQETLLQTVERLRQYVREAGRDPNSVGIEGRINAGRRAPEEWAASAAEWQELGAGYLSLNTMGAGYKSPAEHIDALRRFKEQMGARQ